MKKFLVIISILLISMTSFASQYEWFIKETIKLTNKERNLRNINSLKENKTLNKLAMRKAQLMAKEGKLSHTAGGYKNFTDFLKSNNIKYWAAGENIALNQKLPEQVIKDWMSSKGHRANILNEKYTDIGVAKYMDPKTSNVYWVQIFIKERD